MKMTKASKDHDCSLCQGFISKGEKYLAEKKVSQGEKGGFYSLKRCSNCAQRLLDSEVSLMSVGKEKLNDEQIAIELSIKFKVMVKKINDKFQFVG